MNLNLSWNYDRVMSDPLTAGKLYYRAPYSTRYPFVIGTVSDIVPKFSVAHSFDQVTGDLTSVITGLVGHINKALQGLSKAAVSAEALWKGASNSSKLSNVVHADFNNNFKQYAGSSYNIELPTLTVTLLPTDRPEESKIDLIDTPAMKLVKLLTYQIGDINKSIKSDGSNKVGPDLSKDLADAENEIKVRKSSKDNSNSNQSKDSSNSDQSQENEETTLDILANIVREIRNKGDSLLNSELDKLYDSKIIGSSAYLRSQILTVAPADFVRQFNYMYPSYLRGTFSLVINGIIYRNLLISDISVECSKTRLIDTSLGELDNSDNIYDRGPSWIKVTFTFIPAINWTVRDIEDLLMQMNSIKTKD